MIEFARNNDYVICPHAAVAPRVTTDLSFLDAESLYEPLVTACDYLPK
jgi:hypothetical protein